MRTHYLVIFTCFSLLSCNEASKVDGKKQDLSGKHFELKEDNISVFLPKYFKQYSIDEYEEIILSIENPADRESELGRFNSLKFSNGNVYFLKDLTNNTDISVKMMEYFPFSKKDSSQLLGMLSQICNESAALLNRSCTKLKAAYSGNARTKVFMAKYKIGSKFDEQYTTFYAVTSNYKTFIITFRSNIDMNYNKYMEKIIVK